jgi:two-component system phosphate regulon sensor histidine kinase PhoR
LIVLRDITDIHNVEQIRRDFVANISHELRTPVTVLLGYLELLQNHPARDVAEAVKSMHGQTLQMKALLDDLLELSRLQSDKIQGEEREIDIPAMLEQLREQAEEISHGRHELKFEIEPGLWLNGISADLESAFRNLIINAIRYTPDAGRIEVSWQDCEEGPSFSVKDTGIGIPKRDLPRLTERFYRVDSNRARQSGGTGLGLAIVKHVLNAHKARLIIRSELGEGSEFICVFPRERGVMCLPLSVDQQA